MAKTPRLVHLATLRPVDLISLSHSVLDLRAKKEDWLELIENTLDILETKKIWHEEAANIFVASIRAIRSFDTDVAIQFGYRYLYRIDDERAKKTMVNMLLLQRKTSSAIEILQSSANSLWATRKRIELMEGVTGSKSYESHYLDIIGRNTLGVDFRPAILIYGDVNLNVIDGSSVWLSSTAEAFAGMGFDVHVLMKENIKRGFLIDKLIEHQDIRTIEPNQFGINDGELSIEQAVELIEILDGVQGGYKTIILRGLGLCTHAAGAKSLWKRIWAYLTDYYIIDPVKGRVAKPEVKELLSDIQHVVDCFFVQTAEIRNNLIEEFEMLEEQLILFPPIIPTIEKYQAPIFSSSLKLDVLKIGYSGKIAPLWGVWELIDVTNNAISEGYDIEVHIIGDKIHANTPSYPDYRDRMEKLLTETKHVTWHGAQTRESAMDLMSSMDVAWCYRSPELESQTLELSTKLLESMSTSTPMIVTRSAIHEQILGVSYPLFVDAESDIPTVIARIMNDHTLAEIDFKGLYHRAMKHSLESIRKEVIAPLVRKLDNLPDDKVQRILLNGHDLKFIGEFESHLKKIGHIVRRDRWDWGEPLDEKRSKVLLSWADIIFSEWGLANSVYYSENSGENQHHVIRIHLQEINDRARRFPAEINTDGVNKVVFVAEHIRKMAEEMFDWQEVKTITIPNYVDVNRHLGEKIVTSEKTLGLVGIIPMRKRLDRALDVLKILRRKDSEWKMIVKGKKPSDIPFMKAPNRKHELDYYDEQYRRTEVDHSLRGAVIFEGYTTTIASWYRKIGYVLSPSDFESFHYSISDGVSSGAIPIIWPWEGATEIYPPSWVVKDTKAAAKRILNASQAADLNADEDANREYILNHFGTEVIFAELMKAMGLE